jgi:hypothetical protein
MIWKSVTGLIKFKGPDCPEEDRYHIGAGFRRDPSTSRLGISQVTHEQRSPEAIWLNIKQLTEPFLAEASSSLQERYKL